MSDNTQIPDSDLIASDDIGGVKHQRVKLVLGADGVSDGDVSSSNPMPVSGAFWQATQPISGTVTVDNPTAQGLTDAQIRATALPVSGAVSIDNLPATQPVSGTFWQATQPISGSVSVSNFPAGSTGLTDTELRAAPVPVSGSFYQTTQPVSAASLPLPTGAATDAMAQALTTLNDTMLYMLSAILEKMPRVTGNDQAAVSIEGGTVAAVTNVGSVSEITRIGGKAAAFVPDAISQLGALHLYQNITVTP